MFKLKAEMIVSECSKWMCHIIKVIGGISTYHCCWLFIWLLISNMSFLLRVIWYAKYPLYLLMISISICLLASKWGKTLPLNIILYSVFRLVSNKRIAFSLSTFMFPFLFSSVTEIQFLYLASRVLFVTAILINLHYVPIRMSLPIWVI